MPAMCCAYGCSERDRSGGSIIFHSFPKDPLQRRLWAVKTRRKNFVPNRNTKICSKHFEPHCFDPELFGGTFLKSDAVPTLFDFPDSEKKSPPKSKKRRKAIVKNDSDQLDSDYSESDLNSLTELRKEYETLLLKLKETTPLYQKQRCPVGDFTDGKELSPAEQQEKWDDAMKVIQDLREKNQALNEKNEALEKEVAILKAALNDKSLSAQYVKPIDSNPLIKEFLIKEENASTSQPICKIQDS